jgi:aminoglycoside phosphotransferase (APT) family kinase protein
VKAGSWLELTRRFGLGQVTGDPDYVTRGFMGEIWCLTTSRGRFAVKWQFPWAPDDPHPADVQVQLAAAAAGIPLPLPVLAPDGVAVAEVGGRLVRIYEWVDLAGPAVPPVPAAMAAEAGRLLGLLHSLAIPASGYETTVDPWYTRVPDAAYWTALAERAIAAGTAWGSGLASARGLIADLGNLVIPPSTPPVICHRDFNPDNVFPSADGDLVVLDWENAGPLSPERELGYAVFTWCADEHGLDQVAARALVAAYAEASGRDVVIDHGFFATAIATHVNVLGVVAEQALDEPGHRAFAERNLAELLEHHLYALRDVVRLGFSWTARPRARESASHESAGKGY